MTMRCVTLLALLLASSGCAPIAVSGYIATIEDISMMTVVRRAYIVQRQADGKPDSQIVDEIRQIDTDWEIDLELSGGDLMASTRPYQLDRRSCTEAGRGSPRRGIECKQIQADQRAVLHKAGITID